MFRRAEKTRKAFQTPKQPASAASVPVKEKSPDSIHSAASNSSASNDTSYASET